ncbi:MAG: RecX family transcriptional regulator [Clostridia bacterium]|nr:RecX family transcriptional regulator [Clostridia bacterium]
MNSGFSDKSLRKQLAYEEFTDSQINYALRLCGADWNQEAAKKAKSYLRSNAGMTRARLQRQLEYEGFTAAQVAYGLSHCGKSW